MKASNNRKISLDFARSFAILAVLLCHSIEFAYPISLFNWTYMVPFDQYFRIIGFTLGRLGVPIFLALTGYFLLSEEISCKNDVIHFYKKHLFPLLLTYEIWVVIYQIFLMLFNRIPFYPVDFLKCVFLIKGNGMIHIWYMPLILGLYIAIPFLSFLLKTMGTKIFLFPFCIAFLMSMLIPNISQYYQLTQGKTAEAPSLNVAFLGGYFGLYLFAGFLCRQNYFRKLPAILIFITFFVSFSFTCYYQLYQFNSNHYYDVWYDFSGLFIAGISLFELFCRIPNRFFTSYCSKCITKLSKVSLGMYFLHMPILMCINVLPGIKGNLACNYTIINWILAVVISILTMTILKRIPFFKKYIFYIH